MLPQLLDPRPYFADLPDPRRETQNKLHNLHDILMMVLCAVLSGVEDWVGMEALAGRARWVLAQRAVAEKSNEITAIPDLLGLLDLEGAGCDGLPENHRPNHR